ncbi:MAG TPA: hypothetical protein VGH96_22010, partial [Streptosporangiaceae bacterium]
MAAPFMVFPAAYRYKMDAGSREAMKGRREPGTGRLRRRLASLDLVHEPSRRVTGGELATAMWPTPGRLR